ncbi:alcohol dehydrogenase 2 [Culex quinquefasciatus]|uniref:Alcohol dehydrogenase 2 n=1 Tax=Culex quinquefasciatus TaxID=7176 RepID=B0XI42_CULQU|nr:alcohol dehydrogenase 2 [Culex quinquefasciatus]|eukprot:XP_001869314.1 alcohol dehydrogenase 2 [Culex quinquefasciatus]
MLLEGKTAIITGGASGIGFATAEELLKNGKILILDLCDSLSEEQESQLQSCNPKSSIFYSKCDVTNKSNVEKAFRQDAVKWLGSIDILVNSAGILNESDPAGCVAVNLTGLIDCTLTAMELMSRNNNGNGGIVVNISSIAGLEPLPFCVTYSATKFGIIGFTRSMGQQIIYNKTGVKVMAICPGATETAIYNNAEVSILSFPWMSEYIDQLILAYKTQKPEVVGKAVVKIITEGNNGSVWVVSEDLINPVTFKSNKFAAKL